MDDFATILKDHKEYGDRLHWITGGSDEYLDRIYKACDCLIAASDAEGFGLPLIEAAQYGIPVIARAIPVFQEVAGVHAFYFENSADAGVIADAVVAWAALEAIGEHPKSADMPWLTWRQSASQLFDVIRLKQWSYETVGQGALGLSAWQDHTSPRLIWDGFGAPESDKRWSSGTRASLRFVWGGSAAPARLNLKLSTLGHQQVGISLNGASIHGAILEGHYLTLALNLPELVEGSNVLDFLLPDARRPDLDGRTLAIAIHSLSISPALKDFELGVDHSTKSPWIEWTGFSTAEPNFRWTDGRQASASLFLAEPDKVFMLSLRAFALGDQNVTIKVNGEAIFSGMVGPISRLFKFKINSMKPGYNVIGFSLPDAHAPGNGDHRMLGLALESLRLDPLGR